MTLPESLGALFREARTAQGLSLEALARALHVPIHLLEAIEADDWEGGGTWSAAAVSWC